MAETATRTELAALVLLQVEFLLREGAVILSRDDDAGIVVAAVPDAAVVEYHLHVRRPL